MKPQFTPTDELKDTDQIDEAPKAQEKKAGVPPMPPAPDDDDDDTAPKNPQAPQENQPTTTPAPKTDSLAKMVVGGVGWCANGVHKLMYQEPLPDDKEGRERVVGALQSWQSWLAWQPQGGMAVLVETTRWLGVPFVGKWIEQKWQSKNPKTQEQQQKTQPQAPKMSPQMPTQEQIQTQIQEQVRHKIQENVQDL